MQAVSVATGDGRITRELGLWGLGGWPFLWVPSRSARTMTTAVAPIGRIAGSVFLHPPDRTAPARVNGGRIGQAP